MTERIQTLYPEGKEGVNIVRDKYETMRTAIHNALSTHGELTFTELREQVEAALAGNFEGSVAWYLTTVKLDLEARDEIKRVPDSSPQRLVVVNG